MGMLKDFQDMLFAEHPQLLLGKDKPVLVLGCGNSTLSYDLYKLGFTDITSIDYSPTVIEKMKAKHADTPSLKWILADMRSMTMFTDNSFDFILEKGALDAFMAKEGDVWNPDESVLEDVGKALKEIRRLLKPDGLYIQISFQQPHFRNRYLSTKKAEDLSSTDPVDNLYRWKVSNKQLGYGLGYFMYTCKPY